MTIDDLVLTDDDFEDELLDGSGREEESFMNNMLGTYKATWYKLDVAKDQGGQQHIFVAWHIHEVIERAPDGYVTAEVGDRKKYGFKLEKDLTGKLTVQGKYNVRRLRALVYSVLKPLQADLDINSIKLSKINEFIQLATDEEAGFLGEQGTLKMAYETNTGKKDSSKKGQKYPYPTFSLAS